MNAHLHPLFASTMNTFAAAQLTPPKPANPLGTPITGTTELKLAQPGSLAAKDLADYYDRNTYTGD